MNEVGGGTGGDLGSVSCDQGWEVFSLTKQTAISEIKKSFESRNYFEILREDDEILEFEEAAAVPKITNLDFGSMMKVMPKKAKKKKNAEMKKMAEIKPEIVEENSECVDCEVEHMAFERSTGAGLHMEINNVNGETRGKPRKGKVTVDSGAEDSVWPAPHVCWNKVAASEDSAKGIGFVAANGEKMYNYGTTQVAFKKDGKVKTMNFSVTDCKKPLASVSKIVDRGNRVVFDDDESYILNKKTGEKILLERERGTYVMVVEFEADESSSHGGYQAPGFRRHA